MRTFKKLPQKIILSLGFLFIKEVKGEENLPKNCGYIVASNHASYIDPVLIAFIILKKQDKIISYIGKKEALNNIFFRFLYRIFDVIPINTSSKSKKPIIEAIKILKNDNIIGIFPEGARTIDGKIHSGKTGVARLAFYSNKPIVPVAIKNTYILWPLYRKLPKVRRIVKINIGKPMDFVNFRNKRISKKMLRLITESLMKKITQLYSDIR